MASITTSTTNTSVDYIAKDFNSIQDGLINYATINFGSGTSANRLWSDFNASSFSRNFLEIVAYTTDLILFYLDVQSTEAYLQTATLTSSVYAIAEQFGFVPATAASSSGSAAFSFTGTQTLPPGFRVSASGQEFFTTASISGSIVNTPVVASLLQGSNKLETFTAVGVQNEQFQLIGPTVIQDLNNPASAFISPQITVNGNPYTLVSSFLRFNGNDSAPVLDSLGNVIGGGGRVFTLSILPNDKPVINFGDGIFGRKLLPGENVQAFYRTGGGSAGNISKGVAFTAVTPTANLSTIISTKDFSGGTEAQSIEQLRQLIPASLRTLERAVSERDYSDILKANFTEVFDASTEINTTDPGIDINIYVVPNGVGIAKITDNTLLMSRLSDFLDRRKMVTVQYKLADAYGIDTLITLDVFLTNTASKTTVKNSIISVLQNYFSLTTGGESGGGITFAEPILLKNIVTLIETVAGIDRFEIRRLTYRPRVDESVIGLLSTYSVSEVSIYPTIEKLEWLLGASGTITKPSSTGTPGNVFSNSASVPFTYTSGTGDIVYSLPVDLSDVAPGDFFRDGAAVDFVILAVSPVTYSLSILPAQTVNLTPGPSAGGSVRNGQTSYESYKVFKKILATATNLAINSITDSSLDVTVFSGSGTALSARVLLDNSNVYKLNTLSTGDFLLVDSAGNIWDIVSNDSNTIKVSITALNDAGITALTSGSYSIVKNLANRKIVFQGNSFGIIYNTQNTFYSIGALFNQIGTIGDSFQISEEQLTVGNLGVAVDPITYNNTTKELRLNGAPDLSGVNEHYVFIDSSKQIFNLAAVDNRAKTITAYDSITPTISDSYILAGSGLGIGYAQGFKVTQTDTYTVAGLYLKRMGNVVGSLSLRIVNDLGGLPNLSSPVAVSNSVVISTIAQETNFATPIIGDGKFSSTAETGYQKIIFDFVTPPNLVAGTQYHLVLNGDVAYSSSFNFNALVFNNSPFVSFNYSSSTGIVSFSSNVNLASVVKGNYFQDGAGNFFKVLDVNDSLNTITIDKSKTVNQLSNGNVYSFDCVSEAVTIAPAALYADGKFSRFDGGSWANETLGFPANLLAEAADGFFSIEGPKSIKVASNLTPVLGVGATLATRYYDDSGELSLILGFSGGTITSAVDVNAMGKGTVATIPDSKVDSFIFRTASYADDIINLRLNEIPQIKVSDIVINAFGGVE
jgi:hypothetical protein